MKNHSIRYGIIAGMATVSYFLAFFTYDKVMALSLPVFYSSFLIYFVLMWLAIKQERTQVSKGVWDEASKSNIIDEFSFRKAVSSAFLVFVVANLIYTIFYYITHHYQPELEELQRQAALEWAPSVYPKDRLAEELRNLENADMSVTFKNSAFQYVQSLLVGFVFSVTMAFIERFMNNR